MKSSVFLKKTSFRRTWEDKLVKNDENEIDS